MFIWGAEYRTPPLALQGCAPKTRKEEYGYQDLPEGYAGKCHLCVGVRKHLSERGDFQEIRPKEFYENI